MTSNNPWLSSPSHSSLIPIGTHSLHLRASGPARKPGDLVAITMQGLSASISSWAAVTRLLSPHVRIFTYSRSGFHPSEASPLRPTAENIALELDLLLQAAGIEPPYVLVAHSWGGIIARDFVARREEGEIAGVVFVEANQGQTLDVLDWRPFFLWCAAAEIDLMKVLELEKKRKLDDEEWRVYLSDMSDEGDRGQGGKEWDEYEGSFETWKSKGKSDSDLFGKTLVSVVKGQNARGLKKLYDAVVENGYGTAEEKLGFGEFLETFDEKDFEIQSEVRKFSYKSRFTEAKNSGHDVQLTDPEGIVEEVRWVLAQYLQERKKVESRKVFT